MRDLNRRSFTKLAAAAAGGAALTACGPRPAGRDTPLRIMAVNHVWSRAIRDRLGQFEELVGRPTSMALLTGDQLANTYNVRLNASATDIDVMMVRALQEQALFAHNDWLTDLTGRVTSPGFDWPDFQPPSRTASTVAGKVLSVPVVTERPALYYRKDLGPPPATLAELQDRSRELNDPQTGFYGFVGRGKRGGAVTQWSSFLFSFGGDFVVGGRSAIATPAAVTAYQYYADLLGRTGPPGASNMDLEQAMPVFAQGKAAFYVDADAIYTSLIDPTVSTVQDTIGFAPFPAGPAGSKPYDIPSWSIAINRFSQLQDDAWQFIQWASGPEMVKELQTAGIPGARSSVWNDPATLAEFPPELAATMQINARNGIAYDRPRVLQVGRARDIVGQPLVAGIIGESVPPVAAAAGAEFAEFLIRDDRHREGE